MRTIKQSHAMYNILIYRGNVPNKLYCLTKGGDVGNKHMQCTIYCFIERNSNKYVPNKLYCLTKGGDVGNKHMQSCIQFCLIL